MKIIHVAYKAEEYGIGTFLYSLVSYQKIESEITEVAIVFNALGPNEENFLKIGLKVYSLGLSTAKDIRAFFQFIKIFKSYDIINLHGYSPWAFFAGFILRKKIIYTFHGALGLKGGVHDLFVKIYHRLFVNRYCQKITFASQASLNRYQDGFDFQMNPLKMVIFPYGLQVDRIHAKVPPLAVKNQLGLKEKIVIGTAARMDPYKRLERLLEAFGFLPDPTHFRLVIMGEGDPDYKKYLSNEAKRLKIEKYVLFLGFRSDVLDIINAMDLFVLPTKNECFGLALLEAMALGIPCGVFNDGGGAVDIIGDSGFILKDTQELGEIIQKLQCDPQLKDVISKKVKERASRFAIKYTAENLNEIYKEAMK